MSFQRPFLISLRRTDPREPWGFRLMGGKEYQEPHVVQQVAPESVAERSGLHEDDEVIQVGRVNIQDLSHGMVQEVIDRCGDRLEFFVIREDFLQGKKGKNEPSTLKAVVHSPYNSPLQLYSTENIADALAQQTSILTEGDFRPGVDINGYDSPMFHQQKSAVYQVLQEERAREQYHNAAMMGSHGSPPTPKKVPPPPPPKPKVSTPVQHSGHPQFTEQRHTSTAVIQTSHPPQRETRTQAPPTAHQHQQHVQQRYPQAAANYLSQIAAQPQVPEKVAPPPPVRTSSHSTQANITAQRYQQQVAQPAKYTSSIHVAPSPPSSPSVIKRMMNAVWPPKRSTVKEMPKTGFSPTVMREQGTGRRLVWPPPKSEDEMNGRITPTCRSLPQSPSTGRRIAWNPSPSPPPTRKMQFCYDSPQFARRNKGVVWPPQQVAKDKPSPVTSPKPTRKLSRTFEDYARHQTLSGVPATYRPPPGTQHVEISCP